MAHKAVAKSAVRTWGEDAGSAWPRSAQMPQANAASAAAAKPMAATESAADGISSQYAIRRFHGASAERLVGYATPPRGKADAQQANAQQGQRAGLRHAHGAAGDGKQRTLEVE